MCTLLCGDGGLRGGEACDDFNLKERDGCSISCFVEEGWTCSGTHSVCKTTCGDGFKAGLEECDDPKDPVCPSSCTINKTSSAFKTT